MIIDAHVHVGWDCHPILNHDSKQSQEEQDIFYKKPFQNAEELLKKMARHGIGKSAIFPFPVDLSTMINLPDYEMENKYILECARKYPDKFYPVLAVNPLNKASVESFKNLANGSAVGCKIHPMFKKFPHERLKDFEIIDFLGASGQYLVVDVFDFSTRFIERHIIETLMELSKKVVVQIPHCAGFNMDLLEKINSLENVFVDISPLGCLVKINHSKNMEGMPKNPKMAIEKILSVLDEKKILFGTDEPYAEPNYRCETCIVNMLNARQKELMCHDNYLRMLELAKKTKSNYR